MDFDTRKQAFENKFVHDQEIDFKVQVLAIREVSKWVMELIPDKLESARHYADTLTNGPLVEKGFQAVIEQIKQDLSEAEEPVDPNLIIIKFEKAMTEFKSQ